jgi:arylsulfatase A-like enzyme
MASGCLFFALLVPIICDAKAPHIVLMVIDDIGYHDVGYHGSDFPTPNIDVLATQGVRLERYYVQQVCSPTRSALMSGRYPFRTGMQHKTTIHPQTKAHLPLAATTLAEALGKVGYRRHAIGKWHLGYASWNYTPTGRGFESHAGYLQGQGDYYTHTNAHGGLPDPKGTRGFDFWRNRSAAKDQTGTYSMDFYMNEAARILEGHDPEEPLFLYFAHQQTHLPLQAPPEAEYSRYCASVNGSLPLGEKRHTFCTMMARLDAAIGDFVKMLKAKGIWEDTILWVTSDNGGMTHWGPTWFEASVASNYPLRGGKATLFEGGMRTVSFVTGGFLPDSASGAVRHELIQHVDVAETLAQLGGANLGASSDGYNVWETIAHGEASPRTEVPLNIDASVPGKNFSALIQRNWKLIHTSLLLELPFDGWWSPDPYRRTLPKLCQMSVKVHDRSVMLFDIGRDPEERYNVALSNQDVVLRMLRRIDELADPKNGYRDPQPLIKDPQADPKHHDGCLAPWLDGEIPQQLTFV